MKIAAYLDSRDRPVSLYAPGRIRVFDENVDACTGAHWHCGTELAFGLEAGMTLGAVKAAVARLAAAIDADCRVLLSGEVRGLPYSVLQEWHGFHTWKSEGALAQQLDDVRDRENEARARQKYELVMFGNQQVPAPMLTRTGAAGHYWIDLRAALEHPSNPTSRNVLIPFLEAGLFVQLDILCGHIPKWMAWELERMDLAAQAEPSDDAGDGVRVTVYSRKTRQGARLPAGLSGALPALTGPGQCRRQRLALRAPVSCAHARDAASDVPIKELSR